MTMVSQNFSSCQTKNVMNLFDLAALALTLRRGVCYILWFQISLFRPSAGLPEDPVPDVIRRNPPRGHESEN